MGPQKGMGGIVIDIWEKSNFFGAFGSQKDAKNAIFVQVGLKKGFFHFCREGLGQGLVKGANLCLNPYFLGWLEKWVGWL